MAWGFTTRSAPAWSSRASADSTRARAMTNTSGRSAFALRVRYTLSLSPLSTAMRVEARSRPAAASTASSVASPTTKGTGASRTASSRSTTTTVRPAAERSATARRPMRPHPQTTTWSDI